MQEFLRRTALWAHAISVDRNWPLLSVAEALSARLPSIKARLGLHELDHKAARQKTVFASRVAQWFLDWTVIERQDEVVAFKLLAPYEPAIVLLERGGYVHIENRMFQIRLASFPIRSVAAYLEQPPFVELDEQSLAAADEVWQRDHRSPI
jgi:hypothetical protein